ncbi:uncharacterized protein KGF55_000721 [Candida pseudojiufengensis]|uniref:uncharacterized protein n=1 Tax=Candida pseudojiufengensis TaxID=497109 RepID=UPI00222598C0|nr:uncharacterized protein KGF55_000721 [Candida pseudojiufengensis]KAI5966412.1 hypothetical protein KGF55_000721 [Candida pseudojiufengensis]
MGYSKQQKLAIIKHLKSERAKIAKKNEDHLNRISQQTYQKVIRRMNGVSVTLLDIKLKDVLNIERSKKLQVKSLIEDIQNLKKQIVNNQKS